MIRFFKKLFKRGDFMTRADKAYYKYRAKTIFWSAFCLIIIAWVGTNLVLCALTTNVTSNSDIIYYPAKDVYLPSGIDMRLKMLSTSTKTITFDRYTPEINKKIQGLTGTEIVESVTMYKSADGADVYVLSNDNMIANEDCQFMFSTGNRYSDAIEIKCEITTITLNNFYTQNVKIMNNMFYESPKLEKIVGLNKFDTSNVTTMFCMFCGCDLLQEVDVTSFKTENVTSMYCMFDNCREITELDLSSFYTPNVTDIGGMFDNCPNLTTIYVSEKWTTESLTHDTYDQGYIFRGDIKLVGGKGTVCTGSGGYHQDYYARIDGGTKAPGYFTYKPYSGN